MQTDRCVLLKSAVNFLYDLRQKLIGSKETERINEAPQECDSRMPFDSSIASVLHEKFFFGGRGSKVGHFKS